MSSHTFFLLIAWAHISLKLNAKVGFSFITKIEKDEVISLPDPDSGGTKLVKTWAIFLRIETA
jgi:hypothetical protein